MLNNAFVEATLSQENIHLHVVQAVLGGLWEDKRMRSAADIQCQRCLTSPPSRTCLKTKGA